MNCVIIDDELPAIEELRYFITNFSSINIVATFDNSLTALEYLQNHPVDILFLDINMPKLDGLTLSRVANTIKPTPLLVFISAYKEYALEAFEVSAFDYILKPYSEERIADTLKRIEGYTNTKFTTNKITLWKNESMFVLNVDDIFYCKASGHDVLIYTMDEEFKNTSSISSFYKKLPQDKFFKCHRSYIVNLDRIAEIIPWFNNTFIVKLHGIPAEIPVSRQNISLFKQLMGI